MSSSGVIIMKAWIQTGDTEREKKHADPDHRFGDGMLEEPLYIHEFLGQVEIQGTEVIEKGPTVPGPTHQTSPELLPAYCFRQLNTSTILLAGQETPSQ